MLGIIHGDNTVMRVQCKGYGRCEMNTTPCVLLPVIKHVHVK